MKKWRGALPRVNLPGILLIVGLTALIILYAGVGLTCSLLMPGWLVRYHRS